MRADSSTAGKATEAGSSKGGHVLWYCGAGTVSLASAAAYIYWRRSVSASRVSQPKDVSDSTASEESAPLPPPKKPVFPKAKEREHTVLVSINLEQDRGCRALKLLEFSVDDVKTPSALGCH